MVGTSGQASRRFGPATAIGRTCPPSTRGFAWEKNVNAPWIAPVATAATASPDPRYGTARICVAAAALSCASVSPGDEAGPEVPKLYLLGLPFASASSSASVLNGNLALIVSTSGGPSTIQPIWMKSS